jgi:hypothetical protein
MLLFLKLYLAHLLSDFLLQPNWIARSKKSISRLALHSLIHFVVTLALINFGLTKRLLFALIILVILHAVSDYLKARLTQDDWLSFTLDQFVHLILIIVAAVWLTVKPGENAKTIIAILLNSTKLYLYLCVYVATIFGGGYFVQKISQYFMREIGESLAAEKPGLPKAGKYIGWLERSLVLTFILAGYPGGIGLLLAAKALVRYPEIKDDKGHFAEYFLVGTLTSVTLALVAGFSLLKLRMKIH